MHHVMFDVDGTLLKSNEFDDACYLEAVQEVLGHHLDTDWAKYSNVTDAGILDQHISENGLDAQRSIIQEDVKSTFTAKVDRFLKSNPAQQVPGAAEFLATLRKTKNVTLSIATGGWYETAIMKLDLSGLDVSKIPVASSNDHYSRTGIMQAALEKATVGQKVPCTYFGDGEWDKKACEALGFNFVLVGSGTSHDQSINDFKNVPQALQLIGL